MVYGLRHYQCLYYLLSGHVRLAMPAKNERTNYLNQAKEVSCGKFNIIFAKVQKTCGL